MPFEEPRLDDLNDLDLGHRALLCLLRAKHWIHRRVDRVELLDTSSLRRTTVLEYQVPPYAPKLGSGWGSNRVLLPFAILRKKPLRRLELRDADGRSLPHLHTSDNARVAARVLHALAESVLDRPPTADTRAALTALARSSLEEGWSRTHDLWPTRGCPNTEVPELWRNAVFVQLARTLGQGFLLLIPTKDDFGDRAVLSMSHIENYDLGSPDKRWREVGRRLGWRPLELELQLDEASLCGSFHIELDAPQDIVVSSMRVHDMVPPAGPGMTGELLPIGSDERGPLGPHAHVHAGGIPFGHAALGVARLQPVRRGWLRSSTVAAVLTTALMVVLSARYAQVAGDPSAQTTGSTADEVLTSLLLAVVGGTAAFFTRPGEHALAAMMLRTVRLAAAVPPLMALVMAVTLAVSLDSRQRWWLLSSLAVLATGVLLKSYLSQPDD